MSDSAKHSPSEPRLPEEPLELDEILDQIDLDLESQDSEESEGEIEPEVYEERVYAVEADLRVGGLAQTAQPTAAGQSDDSDSEAGSPKRAKKIAKAKPRSREFEVIARNFPFKVTEDQVREHFGGPLKVKSVKMNRRGDGLFNGTCYLKFQDAQAMEDALGKQGSKVGERTIYVDKTKATLEAEEGSGDRQSNNSIFISNFGESIGSSELYQFFSRYGPIQGVRVVEKAEGQNKRFAFVDFESCESASKALENDNYQFGELRVRVRPAFKKAEDGKGEERAEGERVAESAEALMET